MAAGTRRQMAKITQKLCRNSARLTLIADKKISTASDQRSGVVQPSSLLSKLPLYVFINVIL